MNYGTMKLFTLLMVPLLVTLAFVAAKTTLVQADSLSRSVTALESAARVTGSTLPVAVLAFDATSAVTGSLTITGVAVSNIRATTATVTWDTDDPSNSLVRYGLASDALDLSATSPVTATNHAVGIANLKPATQYFFEVESTDDDGDTAVDNNGGSLYSFTTVEAALQRRAFVGTVVGSPGASVVLIQQGTGAERIISLPDGYSLRTPGGDRAGSFEDGAEVVILAERVGDEWVAVWVLVKPTKPLPPLTGVVTGVGPTSITITDPNGVEHLFRLTGQAKKAAEDVEIGEVVTVLRGNDNQAKGLVAAKKVRERLLKDIADDEEEGEGKESSEVEIEFKGKRADALIRALERLGMRRLDVLGRTLDRAPADVKIKLRNARIRVEIEIDSDREASRKAKVRFKIKESKNDSDEKEDASNSGISENRGRGNSQKESDESESEDSPGNSGSSDKPGRDNGRGKGNSGKGNGDSADTGEEDEDDDY